MSEKDLLSCAYCSIKTCSHRKSDFPEACPTINEDNQKIIADCKRIYLDSEEDKKMILSAAKTEGLHYSEYTRVEEIVDFAKNMGFQKIGVATCLGLIRESNVFCKILQAKGLIPYSVVCKVGAIDKSELGIKEEFRVRKGIYESSCNPILQAKLLNNAGTELNVVVGLCVGHDSLFIKYSDAIVTTLVTKDRVLGHNPAAALYTSGSYYRRLLKEE
ncbi:DUF1847 domain-containing protein [Selenomonadales bacterium OttesenSCG-928-I06]|nr:DUF1847 domain-containing protein [Selenomonadales bacterium OttesenSCG-928-I06]